MGIVQVIGVNGVDGVVGGVTDDLLDDDLLDGFIDGYRRSRTSSGVIEAVGKESVNRGDRCVLEGVITWPYWCWEVGIEIQCVIMQGLSERVKGGS